MRSSRSIGNERHASPPCRRMTLHAWASQLGVATIIQERGDLRRRASSVTRQSLSARSAITISAKKNDCRCACSAESARPSIRISKPAACKRRSELDGIRLVRLQKQRRERAGSVTVDSHGDHFGGRCAQAAPRDAEPAGGVLEIAVRMPARIWRGLGGQPGTVTSTGMTFDTRPRLA